MPGFVEMDSVLESYRKKIHTIESKIREKYRIQIAEALTGQERKALRLEMKTEIAQETEELIQAMNDLSMHKLY